jgi:hypothetical protein
MLRRPVLGQAINDLNAGGIFLALDRTDVGAVNVSAVRKLFRDKPAACLSLRRLIAMSPGFPTGKATVDEYFTTEYSLQTRLGLTLRNAIVGNFTLPDVGQQRVELNR